MINSALLRRLALPATVAAASLAAVGPAQAAKTSIRFDVSIYPAGYGSNGIDPIGPNPSTGSFGGRYYVDHAGYGSGPNTKVLQLRGGAVIRTDYDYDNPTGVSIQAGDVFRLVRIRDGATLGETSFAGQPTITESPVGQTGFAGTTSAGTTSVDVSLERRIRRSPEARYGTQRSPNYVETVSAGRLSSFTDTAFRGSFATPILSGDFIHATQTGVSIANDTETTTTFSVVTPAGTPAPKDTAPPTFTKGIVFGTKSTSAKDFLKNGLNTFVTVSEPGTVEQTMTLDSGKSGSGTKASFEYGAKPKKKKKSKKKTKKTTAPLIIGSAKGTAKSAGETVALTIYPVKGAKKALKKVSKKKGAKVTITTVIKDAAGNATTSATPYKLTGK